MARCTMWALVLATGCRFQAGKAAKDSGPIDMAPADAIDAPEIDAPPDAARNCLSSWETGPLALSAPVRIAELSGGVSDRDVFVTPDELTVYWSSVRNGDAVHHLYRATRAHWADPFSGITKVSDLDSAGDDGKMSMTADGLDAMIASDRAGHVGAGANSDIWESTRATAQDTFGTANETYLVPSVDSSSDQVDPALAWDGLTLYWSDSTAGHQQIIVASRSSRTSAFGSTSIAVDDPAGVADPAISSDGRVIIFTANTMSNEADIFYETRAGTGSPFGARARLSIDTSFEEGDGFLSYDACDLFFASTQQSSGVYQLFVAHVQ